VPRLGGALVADRLLTSHDARVEIMRLLGLDPKLAAYTDLRFMRYVVQALRAGEARLRWPLERARAAMEGALSAACDRGSLGPSDIEAHGLADAAATAKRALAAIHGEPRQGGA